MKKLRVYCDTSVISFLFADDSPDFKKITEDYFSKFIKPSKYDHFISNLVLNEIARTKDQEKRENLIGVLKDYPLEILNEDIDEVYELAERYIQRSVVPKPQEFDALHVAVATYYGMDMLISWNFKHLSNVNREKGFAIVNIEEGYRNTPRLISPMELFDE